MFENRSYKEMIAIYAIIAIVITLGLAFFHYNQGYHPYYIVLAANIEFFCIFYFLYLPLKLKRKK